MNIKLWIALPILTIAGCRSTSVPVVSHSAPRYRIDVVDEVQQKKFRLALVSEEKSPICVTLEGWPNKGGEVFSGSQRMSLEIPGQPPISGKSFKFAISCPGGCGYHVVKPGRELEGFIGYEQFDKPEEWSALPNKRLIFATSVHWCPGK
jgi:hypothetical protein